mmetsp:Transcript_48245/g.135777  ORF Transcript_48245/g.135777 Transcript_48245/m.135777 type:complete len:222 (+) Transcript_48245:605-1270(+)
MPGVPILYPLICEEIVPRPAYGDALLRHVELGPQLAVRAVHDTHARHHEPRGRDFSFLIPPRATSAVMRPLATASGFQHLLHALREHPLPAVALPAALRPAYLIAQPEHARGVLLRDRRSRRRRDGADRLDGADRRHDGVGPRRRWALGCAVAPALARPAPGVVPRLFAGARFGPPAAGRPCALPPGAPETQVVPRLFVGARCGPPAAGRPLRRDSRRAAG